MAVDVLQEKIRKRKNPSVLVLGGEVSQVPPHILEELADPVQAYGRFCRELLEGLKETLPAVRFSFGGFALMGSAGLEVLMQTMQFARQRGYYVLLDAPELLSPGAAERAAQALLGEESRFPCDGVVVSGYLGSDVIKPFLPYCKDGGKDLFVVARTANKSAPELQDLLSGSRVVHAAAADHVNRYGADTEGKFGYTRVGILAAASAAGSLKALRSKYPKLFLLLDGFDYPNANARNCSYAFDKYGHGAAACGGGCMAGAWQEAGTDGRDFLVQAQGAAQRMKKNLIRYVTIL